MTLPFFLIRYSSLPNLVQNNSKSSGFAYFRRPVNHLFGLKSRTTVIFFLSTVIVIPICDERLFHTLEVNWPRISSFIYRAELLITVVKVRFIFTG